jgi:hypothetical protein
MVKHPTSLRLGDATNKSLKRLAQEMRLGRSAVVEIAIRILAERAERNYDIQRLLDQLPETAHVDQIAGYPVRKAIELWYEGETIFRGWAWGIEIDGIKHVSRHRFGIKSTGMRQFDIGLSSDCITTAVACPHTDRPRMNQAADV